MTRGKMIDPLETEVLYVTGRAAFELPAHAGWAYRRRNSMSGLGRMAEARWRFKIALDGGSVGIIRAQRLAKADQTDD